MRTLPVELLFVIGALVVAVALAMFGLRAGERSATTTPDEPRAFVLDPSRFVPLFIAVLIAVVVALW